MYPLFTQVVNKFYSAFQQGDYKAMQECYHDEIEFTDEVFPLLKGKQVKAMWHMLILSGRDVGLSVDYSNISANSDDTIVCNWEARYRFSLTGRSVHNKVVSRFWFKDDLIIRHVDEFDFYRWAHMAFGSRGLLLGWTPFFRKKVQNGIGQRLMMFINQHPEYKEQYL